MKQIKIIFTRGIQGSSKSTWAKEFVKKDKSYRRVCRDDYRHMLDCYSFSKETESIVTALEESAIDYLIHSGINIIIDSMNLNKQKLQERIDKYVNKYKEQDIEIIPEIKNFPVELEEAIKRDKFRDFSVGEKIIRQTWNKYKNELIEMLEEEKYKIVEYNEILQDCIIVDCDGTLSIRGSRSPYDFSKVREDKVNEPIKNLVNFLSSDIFNEDKSLRVFIFSGRDDVSIGDTKIWLKENQIYYDFIYMRETGDKRSDEIVKQELYEQYVKGKYNVLYIIDDRKKVIDMWRKLGLTTLDVAGNTF